MDHQERGVHFGSEEEDGLHDNRIKVVPSANGRVVVHCGLLKVTEGIARSRSMQGQEFAVHENAQKCENI